MVDTHLHMEYICQYTTGISDGHAPLASSPSKHGSKGMTTITRNGSPAL